MVSHLKWQEDMTESSHRRFSFESIWDKAEDTPIRSLSLIEHPAKNIFDHNRWGLTNHQTSEIGGHIWQLKVLWALLGPFFPVQYVLGPLIALTSNPIFIGEFGFTGVWSMLKKKIGFLRVCFKKIAPSGIIHEINEENERNRDAEHDHYAKNWPERSPVDLLVW